MGFVFRLYRSFLQSDFNGEPKCCPVDLVKWVFDKGLKCKTATIMSSMDLIISAVIDLSIHVVDSGRNCIRGKVFFVFTLYVASKYNAHMKLGARNRKDATRWINSF